ncbi:MAG: hypothetical protein IPJ06_00585 [Saprospiraceae bacterium]|nr:hypothetical protein [Saprospiraceae bacterium]
MRGRAFDEPMSTNRKIGLIVYIFLAAISIWATSESLILTFDIPILVGYLVGSAAALIPAMMLGLISDSINNRKLIPLLLGIVVFLVTWGVSLTTNSHNFYLKGALKSVQVEDIKAAYTALSNLEPNANAIVGSTIGNCKASIQSKIVNFQNEVINKSNPGMGPHADSLKRVVEESMPGSQFSISHRDLAYSENNRINYANSVGKIMTTELNDRADKYQSSIVPSICITYDKINPLLSDLNRMLTDIRQFDNNSIRNTLSSSYTEYHKTLDCINNLFKTAGPLNCTNNETISGDLDRTPKSIDLEHIGNTYKHVANNKQFASSRFLFSLLIAFIVDMGAFVIFYFIVLKDE